VSGTDSHARKPLVHLPASSGKSKDEDDGHVTGHVFEVTNLAFAFTRNLRFKAVYLELAAGIWDSGQFARVSLSEFSPFTASLYYTITSQVVKKRDKRRKFRNCKRGNFA
jgi:hypothetical protein